MQYLLLPPFVVLLLVFRWISENIWSAAAIAVLAIAVSAVLAASGQNAQAPKTTLGMDGSAEPSIPEKDRTTNPIAAAGLALLFGVAVVLGLVSGLSDNGPSQRTASNEELVARNEAMQRAQYEKFKVWSYCAERFRPAKGLPDKEGMDRACGPEPYYDGARDALQRIYTEDPAFKGQVVDKETNGCYARYKTKKAQERCIQHVRTFYR